MQNDLKAREGRQQQEKQKSINAFQAERRKQADEKASLQDAFEKAVKGSAAHEERIRALQQTIKQLQSEVNAAKSKAAALEKDLAACRAERSKAGEEVQSRLPLTKLSCSRQCLLLHFFMLSFHA